MGVWFWSPFESWNAHISETQKCEIVPSVWHKAISDVHTRYNKVDKFTETIVLTVEASQKERAKFDEQAVFLVWNCELLKKEPPKKICHDAYRHCKIMLIL